jgi:micrococcal nuclease
MRAALPFLALAVAVAALFVGRGGDSRASTLHGHVVRVVDGDTIQVRLDDGATERVRYIGIDTPESVKPDTPVQCFAKKASHFNAALVDGRDVTLKTDAEERDRYGRLLAYVYREPDGAFVNARLVQGGYARTLTIAPNVAHAGELADLARAARRERRGLWSAC